MTTTTAPIGTIGTRSRSTAWNVFLWVLQVAAAAMFLSAGINKLAGEAAMVEAFEAIGFGQWFRVLTGTLEMVGAVLLLVPMVAGGGALLLSAVMVGAILTHLVLVGGSALPALVLLVALAPLVWERPGGARFVLSRITR